MKFLKLLVEGMEQQAAQKMAMDLFHNAKPIGQGMQAKVYDHPSEQNSVVKISLVAGSNDPYIRFLKFINQHSDNPFFPRVSSVQYVNLDRTVVDYNDDDTESKRNVNSKYILAVTEKLIPLNGPRIKAVAEQLIRTQLGIEREEFESEFGETGAKNDVDLLNYVLYQWTENPTKVMNFIKNNSRNPQFVKAMEWLSQSENVEMADFHDGNWMVRLTGSGPQLVLIDPLFPEE